jgi:hypothetical protein
MVFLLGLVTGGPGKSKPEVYERIGRAFADKSNVMKKLRVDRTFGPLPNTNDASRSGH